MVARNPLVIINGAVQELPSADTINGAGGSATAIIPQTFTATAGQTTFVPSGGYTVSQVMVYQNGSKLGSSDFTATNGTNIVLAVAASLGDVIDVVKWSTVTLANAVMRTGDTMTGPLTVPSLTITGQVGLGATPDYGSSGQFMQSNGPGAAPSWATPTSLPSGVIMPFAGSAAPSGYLLCAGQAVSRTTFAALFTALGTTYGTGDGSTTFNLPDLRGRTPFGIDNMNGTAANRVTSVGSGVSGTTRGAAGGAETVTLTAAQMPSHNHSDNETGYSDSPGLGGGSCGGGIVLRYGSGDFATSTGAQGGSGAHNNMPPAIMLNYIIKT